MPARGKINKLNQAQLRKQSTITQSDIDAARERWREVAPSRLRDLLDATADMPLDDGEIEVIDLGETSVPDDFDFR